MCPPWLFLAAEATLPAGVRVSPSCSSTGCESGGQEVAHQHGMCQACALALSLSLSLEHLYSKDLEVAWDGEKLAGVGWSGSVTGSLW